MEVVPGFDPGFSTAAMRAIWCSERRVRRLLEVESALATACARSGLIPERAARAIQRATTAASVEPTTLLTEGWTAGTPILPLLDEIRRHLAQEETEFLHYGATSQDILDTATMLQVRDALLALRATLFGLAGGLVSIIERHPDEFVVGRTLLQPAVPIRFAWRVAQWLVPVLDLLDQTAAAAAGLPVQLGGPVGDGSPFGKAAGTVVRAFAEELSLSAPASAWHTDRPRAAPPPLISLEPGDRAWLHARIAERFAAMLAAGLVDEVRALRARGDLHPDLPSMRAVGYRQTWAALDAGDLRSLPATGIAATRQLAKRQLTWLRAMPKRQVVPCDAADATERVVALAEALAPR